MDNLENTTTETTENTTETTPVTETTEVTTEATTEPVEGTTEAQEQATEGTTETTTETTTEEPGTEDSKPAEDIVLEVGGKGYTEADLKDLHESGLRRDDYTKKTMELADQRKAFEEKQENLSLEFNRALEEEKQAYLKEVKALQAIKEKLYPKQLDSQQLVQLAQNSPEEYAKYNALNDALHRSLEVTDHINEGNTEQQQAEFMQYAQEQTAKLMQNDEWKDFDSKYETFIGDLVSNGIDRDVALNIIDADIVQMLADGIKYRGLNKQKEELKINKKVNVKKAPATATPSQATNEMPKFNSVEEQLAWMAKNNVSF